MSVPSLSDRLALVAADPGLAAAVDELVDRLKV